MSFAGRGVFFLRLSPQTSGLARTRRQRGAQLNVEFAFYASRRRLRAWPTAGPEAESLHFIVFPSRPLLRAWPGGDDEGAYGQRVCRGGAKKRGTGAATTISSFRNYSDFTGSQPMDRDYLACLAWLARALWPGGPAGAKLECELEGPAGATRTDYLVYCSQLA